MDKDYKKENTTQYGEFVSSFFSWITPTDQKNRAEELEKVTKKKIKDDEK